MKHLKLLAAVGAAVCALVTVGGASAEIPTGVHLPSCYYADGGQATVPAGTPVRVWMAFVEQTRGRLRSFLRSQHVTASVDGVPIADASGLWSEPTVVPEPWSTFWIYDAGVLAHPGDSLTVTWQVTLDHRIPFRDPDFGLIFDGPGDVFPPDASCTITAV